MPDSIQHTGVVIIGGGPAGLFLAGRLLQKQIPVVVLEQKREIDPHSKSLGIHPVSLELFDEAGIAECFLSEGIRIGQGSAFVNDRKIGTLSFENCPKPYNFILALPQCKTENILNEWVHSLNSCTVIRGAEVTGIHQTEKKVIVRWQKNGSAYETTGNYVVGCDGKDSFVRKQAGIPISGSAYPDTYVMGDYSDNTGFGPEAAIYLHREGLIESFPLPGGFRRWVVKTGRYIRDPDRHLLDKLVKERIGHNLQHQQNVMVSSFGVQHQLAKTFYSERILIAGDAAHVVSPIGGQGMNLGWLTANVLTSKIEEALKHPGQSHLFFSEYSKTGCRIARTVARRAELNMWMGRKQRFPLVTEMLARGLIQSPLSAVAARRFTMRGLM